MRILLSAYACAPDQGSESELGWKKMLDLAPTCNEMTVVTRSHNRQAIENSLAKLKLFHIHFIYYDLPAWIVRWRSTRAGEQINVYSWEVCLFFFLRSRFRKNEFDLVHKITVSTYRFPSFAWYFGRRFSLGPISSGEQFPMKFMAIYSPKAKLHEWVRLLMQRLALLDPFVLLTLYKSDAIITVTGDTRNILPAFARRKATITPVYITVDPAAFDSFSSIERRPSKKLRLLYIGRVMEWKGVMLALRALKNLEGQLDYEFTLMGEGPGKAFYQDYARKHQLAVNFVSPEGIPRRSLSAYYRNHDLFIFPGLHGTGSYVMLEANLHELPVLTLDISIPESFAHYNFGWVIPTKGKTLKEVIKSIEEALMTVYKAKESQDKVLLR